MLIVHVAYVVMRCEGHCLTESKPILVATTAMYVSFTQFTLLFISLLFYFINVPSLLRDS